ncbi:MAG: tRNA (adenosine(37)-N6)-threonylcarbamoyltransferase complex dimerization subunit type 1 TsaB [Planctomycetota bacterium]
MSGSNVSGDVPFSCALRLPTGLVEARSPAGSRGDLAALVAGLCAAHGVKAEQVAEIRLDLGPGSYTGLRVAVTFVRFLQRFGSVSVLAVDSLALMASVAAGHAATGQRLRPLLDARRGRYHSALWKQERGRLTCLAEARALPLAEVLADTAGGDLVVVPAVVHTQVGEDLRALGGQLHVVSGIAAADLFAANLLLLECPPEALEPRYLMRSYAED